MKINSFSDVKVGDKVKLINPCINLTVGDEGIIISINKRWLECNIKFDSGSYEISEKVLENCFEKVEDKVAIKMSDVKVGDVFLCIANFAYMLNGNLEEVVISKVNRLDCEIVCIATGAPYTITEETLNLHFKRKEEVVVEYPTLTVDDIKVGAKIKCKIPSSRFMRMTGIITNVLLDEQEFRVEWDNSSLDKDNNFGYYPFYKVRQPYEQFQLITEKKIPVSKSSSDSETPDSDFQKMYAFFAKPQDGYCMCGILRSSGKCNLH